VGLKILPPSVNRLSRQCGILNISQPYRPPWPVKRTVLLYGDGVCFLWGTNWTVLLQVASISQLTVSRLSRQCGILNISQPYRPPRPVKGDSFYRTSLKCQFVFRVAKSESLIKTAATFYTLFQMLTCTYGYKRWLNFSYFQFWTQSGDQDPTLKNKKWHCDTCESCEFFWDAVTISVYLLHGNTTWRFIATTLEAAPTGSLFSTSFLQHISIKVLYMLAFLTLLTSAFF
jgi:hypothetical protein